MTLIEFINKHWKKYIFYEKELLSLSDYIEIDVINFKTFSLKLEHLLLGICSELDAVFRIYSENNNSSSIGIDKYRADILLKNNNIITAEVQMITNSSIVLKPFDNWGGQEGQQDLAFWIANNNIKHNKNGAEINANLEAVLNGLAALYFVDILIMDEMFMDDDKNFSNRPENCNSNLFYTREPAYKVRVSRVNDKVETKKTEKDIMEIIEKYGIN